MFHHSYSAYDIAHLVARISESKSTARYAMDFVLRRPFPQLVKHSQVRGIGDALTRNKAVTNFRTILGTNVNLIQDGRNKIERSGWHIMSLNDLRAQKGDVVFVHYLGRFPGGKVFDTSMEKEAVKAGLHSPARDYKPLQVKLGAGQVIPGFEEALLGMKVNEEKEVTIPPDKAYGKAGKHPMAGKTLQFKLRVTNIRRD